MYKCSSYSFLAGYGLIVEQGVSGVLGCPRVSGVLGHSCILGVSGVLVVQRSVFVGCVPGRVHICVLCVPCRVEGAPDS